MGKTQHDPLMERLSSVKTVRVTWEPRLSNERGSAYESTGEAYSPRWIGGNTLQFFVDDYHDDGYRISNVVFFDETGNRVDVPYQGLDFDPVDDTDDCYFLQVNFPEGSRGETTKTVDLKKVKSKVETAGSWAFLGLLALLILGLMYYCSSW